MLERSLLCALVLMVMITPLAWPQDAEVAARKRSVKNLQALALAMHEYHDVMGTMPPAVVVDREKKPLLSWRVLLLPHVGERDLFKQFKLDEPWDSTANKNLLERMPNIYAPVGLKTKEPFTTFYQVLHGEGAAFEGTRGAPITEFVDGTSNTVLVIEGGEAVPWTKPAELSFVAKKPLPKLGGLFKERIHCALADGSVVALRRDFDEKAMRALVGRNDGQPIDVEDLLFVEK
jgi:hypothetical protein